MGRRAQGWKLEKIGGTFYVRFTHAGKQRRYATGSGDYEVASVLAAQRYAEIVSGRRVARHIGISLRTLAGEWLAEYEKDHDAKTSKVVGYTVRSKWLPFFGDVEAITPAGVQDYIRHRLTEIDRSTVRKEVSNLRQFIAWAELGFEIPRMKQHGYQGRRAANARKEQHVAVDVKTIHRILNKIPIESPRGHKPLRAFFELLWETGLRESILFRLRSPKHYSKGRQTLLITPDINKAHVRCELPLTPLARAALEAAVPKEGEVMFPRFHLREPLRKACEEAGVEVLSPYDFRHSRLTALAEAGPLPGVQYLALHGSLSTTARYVHPRREAAEAVLAAAKTRRGKR
jgi:integrase